MINKMTQKFIKTLLLASLIATAIPIVQAEELKPIDRIIAIAENDVILQSELNSRMKLVYEQIQQNNTQPPPEDVLAQQVLERLILENLQLQRGKKAGVRIDDNELNYAMNNIAKQNGLTIQQFKAELEKQGLSYLKTRDQIRDELIISKVQQGSINSRVKVTDQEIDNFLNSEEGKFSTSAEFRVAHILLPFPIAAKAEDMDAIGDKAKALYKELQAGADFQQMAIAKSQAQNALQGGDLGWRKTSQLPSLFAQMVPDLQVGDVPPPIRSGGGYHIIKLLDKRGGTEQVIEQTQVRHILIKETEIRTLEAAEKLINELHDRIEKGEDFVKLAKEFSDDHGSAVGGGDLGWMSPGQLVPEFEAVMGASKPGQLSHPFRSEFGWHILQVIARRDQDMSEQFLRSRAENIIHKRKFDEELQNWVRELRDESFVDIKS